MSAVYKHFVDTSSSTSVAVGFLKPTANVAIQPSGRTLPYRWPAVSEHPATRFERLKATWKQDIMFESSVPRIVSHDSYIGIIGMGRTALPYIFAELEREPDFWFRALRVITGDDPVPSAASGDIEAMGAYWTDWGRENGYL